MSKVRDLSKMPKRKVTVEDVLHREDIESVLADMVKDKEEYNEILAIAGRSDGTIMWRHSGMTTSRMIYFMELLKTILLEEK